MKTFLTPDPLTLEIRNAAGDVRVLLTDTQTTTVEVIAGTSHPLGFLDDIVRNFGGGRRFDGPGRGRQLGDRLSGLFGDQSSGARVDLAGTDVKDEPMDIVDLVRVEHREGDHPTLMVDTDPARDGWRSSFSVVVTAPRASNVRVQAQSADVTLTGVAGLVDVRTASGDIQLDEVQGKTLTQTAAGDVTIGVVGAGVDVRTASGDVQIGPVDGDALIHTTSGDIRLGEVTGNISARTVSGDVRVSAATAGTAEVNAVSGDVQIGIHPGTLASINLTTVSGNTDTDFEVHDEATDGEAPVLQITVKTTSGDIRLYRAA